MDSGTPNDLPARYLVRLAWENRTMDERKAGNPIPTQAIRDLVQRMIADGRPVEEQCTVQILPPLIIQADHKDTTEPPGPDGS